MDIETNKDVENFIGDILMQKNEHKNNNYALNELLEKTTEISNKYPFIKKMLDKYLLEVNNTKSVNAEKIYELQSFLINI